MTNSENMTFRESIAARDLLTRSSLHLPSDRVRSEVRRQASQSFNAQTAIAANSGSASFATVKSIMHQRLLEDLDRRERITANEDELTGLVTDFVTDALATQDWPLNESERKQLVDDLIEETIGVGPLAPLLADPAVSDVLVNGPYKVFVERYGRLEPTEVRFVMMSTWFESSVESQRESAAVSMRVRPWSTQDFLMEVESRDVATDNHRWAHAFHSSIRAKKTTQR